MDGTTFQNVKTNKLQNKKYNNTDHSDELLEFREELNTKIQNRIK